MGCVRRCYGGMCGGWEMHRAFVASPEPLPVCRLRSAHFVERRCTLFPARLKFQLLHTDNTAAWCPCRTPNRLAACLISDNHVACLPAT